MATPSAHVAPPSAGSASNHRRLPIAKATGAVGHEWLPYYRGSSVSDVPRGKPSPKLAITVDADVHERVVDAAAAEGLSVSAWMTKAARRALLVRDGLAAVAEWEAEHGPLTESELAAAHQRVASQMGAAPARARKRSA